MKNSRPGSFPQNLTKLLAVGGEELLVMLRTFQHPFILQINKTLCNGTRKKKEFLIYLGMMLRIFHQNYLETKKKVEVKIKLMNSLKILSLILRSIKYCIRSVEITSD